jgi:hypothetical protein
VNNGSLKTQSKRTPFLVVDIAIVTAYSICKIIRKVVGRFVGLWDDLEGSNSEVAKRFARQFVEL